MHVSGRNGSLRHLRVLWVFCVLATAQLAGPAKADSTVDDQTGLMTQNAIAQIDNRNNLLEDATGTMVAVLVERGTAGETSVDAATAAQKALGSNFSALVWVATGTGQTDIVFSLPAIKWVSPDQQVALRQELGSTLQFCCPSDALPAVVNAIAADIESGAKLPVDPRNYVRDELGLLDSDHVSAIAAREKQLESATGKGVGVILMEEQPGKSSGVLALAASQSLDVKGDIAAVVWVARSDGTLTFSMETSPAFADSIPDSTASNINTAFQGDMQSGQLGDAIAAAVDRTAAALEASSTPVPASAGASSAANPATGAAASGLEQPPTASPVPAAGTSRTSTVLLVLIGLAIVALVVMLAVRRRTMQRGVF